MPKFDATVLSLYARGLTVREIQGHLEGLYEIPIAPDVISTITDEVIAEATAWQPRPLERVYPVVILDAMRVKIRDEGVVRNNAVYLAIGVDRDGRKDVLGLWIEQTEGAAFWLRVMTELKSRGVEDILIALIDGLVGFPEAITTVFPQTQVHHCVVHLVRSSLSYVSWPDRRAVAADLRAIYRAPTEAAATAALAAFEASPLGTRYPPSRRSGTATGRMSGPSLRIRRSFGNCSTPRTRSRVCTGNSGKSSRAAATFRPMKRRRSYSTSSSGISSANGKPPQKHGKPPCPTSPCSSASASRWTANRRAQTSHTEKRIGPARTRSHSLALFQFACLSCRL